MNTLQFKFVDQTLSQDDKNILSPKQKSTLASGFDLASAHKEDVIVKPNTRLLISTGIAISLAPGFEGQIRSRSGLALNHGIVVLNSPGTIDADYRGEIKVLLANFSSEDFLISFGMRIAQLVIMRVYAPMVMEVRHLDESERGEHGFGSTGLLT